MFLRIILKVLNYKIFIEIIYIPTSWNSEISSGSIKLQILYIDTVYAPWTVILY